MATLYPVWRGSLTYHNGTLSFDGAAIYRGTQQGEDDPAPDAIAGVRIGVSPDGIGAGLTGSLTARQRAHPTGISQWSIGSGKLTCRTLPIALADSGQSALSTSSQANIASMGNMLAMGVMDASIRIGIVGLEQGVVADPTVDVRLRAPAIIPDGIAEPTIQHVVGPAGVYQLTFGSHKAAIRQSVGNLTNGVQGEQLVAARLTAAPTAFTGAMGNPVSKYAQIVYPLGPAMPAPSTPAVVTTVTGSAITPPPLAEFALTASVGMRGIDQSLGGIPKAHRIPLAAPTTRDLLPPSVTRLEHLAAATLASNLTPEVITSTRFADTCPVPLLPWLAWARSVDWWELAESEDQQRALIRASFKLHQHKGTPWAIKAALNVLGFGDSTIIERATGRRYDDTISYNGNEPHGDPTRWAVYRVILARPVTTEQANRIKRLLAEMAPARCHLSALDYTMAPVTYNGAATYNGNYNHGAS